MSLLPSNPLINYAQQCMIGSIEQRRVFNEEPMFVKQLEVIEVNNDDDVLEAIKHKFQAEENRHRWIFDDIVGEKELEEYEAQLKEKHRLFFTRETESKDTEEDKKKFGRETLRQCKISAMSTPISVALPYTGYGEGMLHSLADHLAIGWHPDWETLFSEGNGDVADGQ